MRLGLNRWEPAVSRLVPAQRLESARARSQTGRRLPRGCDPGHDPGRTGQWSPHWSTPSPSPPVVRRSPPTSGACPSRRTATTTAPTGATSAPSNSRPHRLPHPPHHPRHLFGRRVPSPPAPRSPAEHPAHAGRAGRGRRLRNPGHLSRASPGRPTPRDRRRLPLLSVGTVVAGSISESTRICDPSVRRSGRPWANPSASVWR
jgi:hypothetical protein